MPFEFLISALVTLAVVVDPLGLVPSYIAVTHGLPQRARRNVALRGYSVETDCCRRYVRLRVVISGNVSILFWRKSETSVLCGQTTPGTMSWPLRSVVHAAGLCVETKTDFPQRKQRISLTAGRYYQINCRRRLRLHLSPGVSARKSRTLRSLRLSQPYRLSQRRVLLAHSLYRPRCPSACRWLHRCCGLKLVPRSRPMRGPSSNLKSRNGNQYLQSV